MKKKHISDFDLWERHRHAIKPLDPKHRDIALPPEKHLTPSHPYQRSEDTGSWREPYDFLSVDSGIFAKSPSSRNFQKQQRVKKVCVKARLDLHGLTRQNALQILQKFILEAQQRGHDWILVITGKGKQENPQTLRKLLPLWLEQIPQVGGYAPAKQKDGGTGAYYVRIRRL